MTSISSDVFVKRSSDPRTGAALRAEGELLRMASHPGVVEVIRSQASGQGWELILRRVRGSDLVQQPCWTTEEVAGFGAAAATTLADLHDLGVVHGRIGPEHLLVDESGRPVLCGFGQARRCTGDPAREDRNRADVADLARCLAARVPAGAPRAVHRVLDGAMAGGPRRHPVTARDLARGLIRSVAGAALPAQALVDNEGPALPPGDDETSGLVQPDIVRAEAPVSGREAGDRSTALSRPKATTWPTGAARAIALAVAVAVAGAAGFAALAGGPSRVTASPAGKARIGSTGVSCPPVDRGCSPVSEPGGVLTLGRGGSDDRYRLGEAGDVVVLGRWTCAGSLPALLQPTTAQVWGFGRWAVPGKNSTATLMGRVAGARSLRVLPGARGCDRVEILRRAGPSVVLGWPRQRAGRAGATVHDRSRR